MIKENMVWRTPLYRNVSAGLPKHLRLTLLNALKHELSAGTTVLWDFPSLITAFAWRESKLGVYFWLNLDGAIENEKLSIKI